MIYCAAPQQFFGICSCSKSARISDLISVFVTVFALASTHVTCCRRPAGQSHSVQVAQVFEILYGPAAALWHPLHAFSCRSICMCLGGRHPGSTQETAAAAPLEPAAPSFGIWPWSLRHVLPHTGTPRMRRCQSVCAYYQSRSLSLPHGGKLGTAYSRIHETPDYDSGFRISL